MTQWLPFVSRRQHDEAVGRARALEEELAVLRRQLVEALANERKAYQMQVNIAMQQRYGLAPYPEAPKLPDQFEEKVQVPTPIGTNFVHASTIAQQKTREFKELFQARLKDSSGRP